MQKTNLVHAHVKNNLDLEAQHALKTSFLPPSFVLRKIRVLHARLGQSCACIYLCEHRLVYIYIYPVINEIHAGLTVRTPA